MFFKSYLNGIAEILDGKLRCIEKLIHRSDIGFLSEVFVRDFLRESFNGIYKIYLGDQIINSEGVRSKQIDIVLCSHNSLNLFTDKGIYPIESVYGVFSIKKELNHTNLFEDCIPNLLSIPTDVLKIHPGILNHSKIENEWRNRHPLKFVFAYKGKIQPEWTEELNEKVRENKDNLYALPWLIAVNKESLIIKNLRGRAEFTDGTSIDTYFYHDNFNNINPNNAKPFIYILNELHKKSTWQYFVTPEYHEYFNQDL